MPLQLANSRRPQFRFALNQDTLLASHSESIFYGREQRDKTNLAITTTSGVNVPMNHSLDSAVEIEEHNVEWDWLAWCTLRRFFAPAPAGPPPCGEAELEQMFRRLLRKLPLVPAAYLNPRFSVFADQPGRRFERAVARARATWLRQLKQTLGSAGRLKHAIKTTSPLLRQLQYTGVLIANGKHVCQGHFLPAHQAKARRRPR